MKLTRLEKIFLVFVLTFALVVGFFPTVESAEAAERMQPAQQQETILYNSGNDNETEVSSNISQMPQIQNMEVQTEGNFSYYEDEAGEVVITDYTGTETTVTVPAEIDGKKVVSLKSVFENNTTVTEVKLPDTVTTLVYGTFSNATNLKHVNLENVKYMEGSNFDGCKNLGDIVLAEGVTIYNSQFDGAKLNSLRIPKLMNNVFEDEGTYLGNFETKELTFTEGITQVAIDFSGIKVPQIVIPDSVTDISLSRFGHAITDKVVLGKGIKTVAPQQFKYMKDAQIQLGSGVTTIGWEAFSSSNIKSLVIPDSVTEIQYDAFAETTALSNITFSKNLKAFFGGYNGCMKGSLWYKNQKDGVVYTGNALYAFKGSADAYTKINVKSGTTTIGYAALQTEDLSSANITEVTLPDGLKYIGAVSFFNTGITSIEIPSTVTEVGAGAFANTSLKSVFIPKSVKTIGAYAFGYLNEELQSSNSVWTYDAALNNCIYRSLGGDCFGVAANDSDFVYEAYKVPGYTIMGYKGSAAETYASKNGFKFVDVSSYTWPGHGIAAPAWTWKGTGSAAAKFTCTVNKNHTKTLNATIKSTVTKKATVSAAGVRTYTAEVTMNNVKYTNTKTESIFLFNKSAKGLQKNGKKLYYVKNGLKDATFTGFAKYGKVWYYVVKGVAATSKTGFFKGKVNGKTGFWYVQKGKVLTSKTAVVKGKVNGKSGSWYVKKGMVQTTFSGKQKIGKKTYKIQKGKVLKVVK